MMSLNFFYARILYVNMPLYPSYHVVRGLLLRNFDCDIGATAMVVLAIDRSIDSHFVCREILA